MPLITSICGNLVVRVCKKCVDFLIRSLINLNLRNNSKIMMSQLTTRGSSSTFSISISAGLEGLMNLSTMKSSSAEREKRKPIESKLMDAAGAKSPWGGQEVGHSDRQAKARRMPGKVVQERY